MKHMIQNMSTLMMGFALLFILAGCGGSTLQVDRSSNVVVIDAGHGGQDSGAVNSGKKEKDAVLQITQKLYKEFRKQGYKIYLTRSNDRFLRLDQRTKIADRKNAGLKVPFEGSAHLIYVGE